MSKILVVDDERAIGHFLEELVESMGHECVTAKDGKEGYEAFKADAFDLCIVDINMPEMDGIEFLEAVKEVDEKAVVIVMTGYPSAATIIKTIEDDGYTYVSKPLDLKRTMNLIEHGLAFREKRISQ